MLSPTSLPTEGEVEAEKLRIRAKTMKQIVIFLFIVILTVVLLCVFRVFGESSVTFHKAKANNRPFHTVTGECAFRNALVMLALCCVSYLAMLTHILFVAKRTRESRSSLSASPSGRMGCSTMVAAILPCRIAVLPNFLFF